MFVDLFNFQSYPNDFFLKSNNIKHTDVLFWKETRSYVSIVVKGIPQM